MIGLLLGLQLIMANEPSPSLPPPCLEMKQAQLELMAGQHVFLAGGTGSFRLGKLGLEYVRASDELSAAMTSAQPDLDRIEELKKEVDRIQIELSSKQITLASKCQMIMLRQLPASELPKALGRMAPMSREKREQLMRKPPMPPPPPAK